MHNDSKVLLGPVLSSDKAITTHVGDPATFLAGLCVSQNSSGLSLLKSDGMRIGVSVGRSLSDHKKTSVVRFGDRVPIRAALKRASCVVTISSYANLLTTTPDTLAVAGTTFTAQSGAATLGTATFRAASSNAATATSLATQINAHATASTKVYAVDNGDGTVSIYSIVEGAGSTGTGNDIAVAYTDNGGGNIGITIAGLSGGKLSGGSDTITAIDYIAIGAKAYVNNTTGKVDVAMSGFSTVTDATFISTELTGIDEDSNEVAAVLVDMGGGL